MGEAGHDEGPAAAELLARAGWLEVLDDIHGGLSHSVNGRVSSLDGLLHMIGMDGPEETPVMTLLEGEVRRLSDTVRAMRSLTGDLEGPAEPLIPAELAAEAEMLHGHHRLATRIVTETIVDEGLPPFRANRPRILRVLLVLMGRFVHRAVADNGASVKLRARGDATHVEFHVGWSPRPQGVPASGGLSARQMEALDTVMALDAGSIEVDPEGVRVRVPAMTRPGV